MTESLDRQTAAARLRAADDILILSHKNPDGDTIGSALGLCLALRALGKNAAVLCSDPIPKMYEYLDIHWYNGSFEPSFVVAVDVASIQLFGENNNVQEYVKRANLCIDHHGSNSGYAYATLVEPQAAAVCEILTDLIPDNLGVPLTPDIANCLYTGISTDTGCFRYASATAESYRIAADLIEAGADNGRINRVMFETKTKTYARLERLALESMRFYLDERVAIITVTQEMYHLTGSNEQETEGLAPLTRQIEGVEVGITIREKPDGTCKASLRTFESVNAAEIAKAFGGGGHPQAAACNLDMDVKTARAKLVEKCGELLV